MIKIEKTHILFVMDISILVRLCLINDLAVFVDDKLILRNFFPVLIIDQYDLVDKIELTGIIKAV